MGWRVIDVPVLMHRVADAMVWLRDRGDYDHILASEVGSVLVYWQAVAKEGPSRDTILFSFKPHQKDLAMIFKMTWSG
jgi:hypothetical protein